MTLNRGSTRTFHRVLFAGILETVTLLKRGDDQQQGTVRSMTLFQCRRSMITKTGEQIAGDMTAGRTATWYVPRVELDRVGVTWLSSADRIVDKKGRTWQPEADTTIEVKLFENHLRLDCKSVT